MLDKLDGRVPAQDGKLCIVNYVICPVTKKKIVAERIIFRKEAKPSEIGFESPEFLLDNQESGRHSLANTTSPNLLYLPKLSQSSTEQCSGLSYMIGYETFSEVVQLS